MTDPPDDSGSVRYEKTSDVHEHYRRVVSAARALVDCDNEFDGEPSVVGVYFENLVGAVDSFEDADAPQSIIERLDAQEARIELLLGALAAEPALAIDYDKL